MAGAGGPRDDRRGGGEVEGGVRRDSCALTTSTTMRGAIKQGVKVEAATVVGPNRSEDE